MQGGSSRYTLAYEGEWIGRDGPKLKVQAGDLQLSRAPCSRETKLRDRGMEVRTALNMYEGESTARRSAEKQIENRTKIIGTEANPRPLRDASSTPFRNSSRAPLRGKDNATTLQAASCAPRPFCDRLVTDSVKVKFSSLSAPMRLVARLA